MNAKNAPAAHVTCVISVCSDASDAKRGVTRMVTRNAAMVTRNELASLLASPLPARHDAVEPFPVTRVTRNAGIPYPLHSIRGEGTPREGTPQRGPAAHVTRVTTLPGTHGADKPSTVWRSFARDGGAA